MKNNMAFDLRNKGRMKGGISVLPIVVGVMVSIAAVVVIAAAFIIYVIAVISLNVFRMGGVEVIGAFNMPYVAANTLANSDVDGRPLLEPALAASVSKMSPQAISKLSGAVKNTLDTYSFPYEVRIEGVALAEAACATNPDQKHKAADISASCGTPVRAFCGGQLSVIGPGLTGDPVFGGTSSGGQEGLQIKHDAKCELSDYRSLYGCVEIADRKTRNVVKGEVIGYVSTCGAEKEQGCHLHYAITKGALNEEEEPKVCDKINRVVEHGVNMIAKKGTDSGYSAEAYIPLIFKDKTKKMVVTIGER